MKFPMLKFHYHELYLVYYHTVILDPMSQLYQSMKTTSLAEFPKSQFWLEIAHVSQYPPLRDAWSHNVASRSKTAI